MRLPKLPLLLAGLPVALAALSLAPAARAGDVPTFRDLPTGHLTILPSAKVPAFIPGREKVAGVFVAMPKHGPETLPAGRHVSVVGDPKQAESIRQGNGTGEDRDIGTCFSEIERGGRGQPDDPEALEWSTSQQGAVYLWPKSKDNEAGGVAAVHTERLVEADGKATLESADVWVDPVTQGARVIARSSLPLAQVGTALGGVKIYAGRDERDGAARFVQFVVVRQPPPGPVHVGSLSATRLDGTSPRGNGCGHLRIALSVEAKNGDSAVVIAPIEISRVDLDAKAAEPDVKAEMADPDDSSRKAKPRSKKRRLSRTPPAATPSNMVEREVRMRDVQINLSVSQTSRDKEPLVGVSFGWASREAVQRFMEEATPATAAAD